MLRQHMQRWVAVIFPFFQMEGSNFTHLRYLIFYEGVLEALFGVLYAGIHETQTVKKCTHEQV